MSDKPHERPTDVGSSEGAQPQPAAGFASSGQVADSLKNEAMSSPSADQTGPEETLWSGRTNWKHFGGAIALWGVGALVLIFMALKWLPPWVRWYFLGVILAAGAAVAVRIALMVWTTRYRLTTERLFIQRGIVRQTINQTELIRVDDVSVRKLLVDRLFGLGTVEVQSTDATDKFIEIKGISDPDRISELIRGRMRALRKKSLFIESL